MLAFFVSLPHVRTMNDLDALVAQAQEAFGQAATPADLENAKAR